MFGTVLVANRGEIAVRVLRTLRSLGVRGVAVHSDADASARHVRLADTAVRIGPSPAARSYLSVPAVVEAALTSGAEAVHPGYGFLSESPALAAACADAGLAFVGPPVAAIEAMGDKIRAKRTVAAAGVPVVPGSDGAGLTDDDLVRLAAEIGPPLLLKPSAGGGGKAMREVHRLSDLPAAIESARREARGAFGDDTLLLERLVASPRHVEVQVLADTHGTVVHLGERECSLQRRHQKVVEEAPSPLLTPDRRERLGTAAVDVARAVGYTGAGTVEFVVSADRPGEPFFLEMNTRLQVEHPVTELVVGLDLVEWQLRVAAGERLAFDQADLRPAGHAVEARVYAEDPPSGFLPASGPVLALREPSGTGVRVDSGVATGDHVGTDYDPLLLKVVAHGADRGEALRRLDGALARTVVLGLDTNLGFLRRLLADPDVAAGRLDTGLVGRRLATLAGAELPDHVLTAAVGCALLALEPATGPAAIVDPFDVPGGWRVGESAWTRHRLRSRDRTVEVRSRGRADGYDVVVDGGPPVRAATRLAGVDRGSEAGSAGLTTRVWDVEHAHAGVVRSYVVAGDGDATWVGWDGRTWALRTPTVTSTAASGADADGPVRSPMPGTVTVVDVAAGEPVAEGRRLAVVEAMKMEHPVAAPVAGVVARVAVSPGTVVARDAVLVEIHPADQHEEQHAEQPTVEPPPSGPQPGRREESQWISN